MPQRVQRRRERGWRMPEGAVYVGRPSKWGNPFAWSAYPSSRLQTSIDGEHYRVRFSDSQRRSWAVTDFENAWVYGRWLDGYPTPEQARAELAGRDLACWCPVGEKCHADVLLTVANGELSFEDIAAIAEDVEFERREDARTRYQDTEVGA